MIQICLVDDHQMFRRGIESLLKDVNGFSLAGSFTHVDDILVERTMADLLLLDLSLEDGFSLNKMPLINKFYPAMRVIILTMHNKPMLIHKAVKAGASGYVIKQSSPSVLIEAVRRVADGGIFLDPALSESLVMLINGETPDNNERQGGFSQLSRREQEVFTLAAEGMTNDQISRKLFISRKTAENHRFRLMKKLELKSSVELMEFAREIGAV